MSRKNYFIGLSGSSSDSDEVSHFVLPKANHRLPKPPKMELFKRKSDKLKCRFVVPICCLVFLLTLLVCVFGFSLYLYSRLRHLTSFVVEFQAHPLNLSNILENQTDLKLVKTEEWNQLHANLSSMQLKVNKLDEIYVSLSENTNIVQYLQSVTQQFTSLSQSVVMLGGSVQSLQRDIRNLQLDLDDARVSVTDVASLAKNNKALINKLDNETLSMDLRLSVVELMTTEPKQTPLTAQNLRAAISMALQEALVEFDNKSLDRLNDVAKYASGSYYSKRIEDMYAKIANNTNNVYRLLNNFEDLKKSSESLNAKNMKLNELVQKLTEEQSYRKSLLVSKKPELNEGAKVNPEGGLSENGDGGRPENANIGMELMNEMDESRNSFDNNNETIAGSNRAGKTSDVDDLVQLAEDLNISNKNRPLEPYPQKQIHEWSSLNRKRK